MSEGVSLLELVVKMREQTRAQDHPDRLASQQVLATMYWDLGRRNTALQMTNHVVEIRRQVLDEHHPDRVDSEAWLEHFEREWATRSLNNTMTDISTTSSAGCIRLSIHLRLLA